MKIFLSYAAEDRDIAEKVYLALLGEGNNVFFDKTSLSPGGEYSAKIREKIHTSDLFIFLISPTSVEKSSYALTELKFASEKWQHPKKAVLPVMIKATDFSLIPNYLKAVTILEPSGNIEAEVSSLISYLKPKPVCSLTCKGLITLGIIIATITMIITFYPEIKSLIINIPDPLPAPLSKNHSMDLTGLVYLDGKLQEHVTVAIPFQSKSEQTNADGKFTIKEVDTNDAIDLRLTYSNKDIDTIIRLNKSDIKKSVYFKLKTTPAAIQPTFDKTLSGFIRSNDSEGIPGVRIETEFGDIAFTNSAGNFNIRIPANASTLMRISFRKEGFRPKTSYINTNQSDVVISLEEL